MGKSTSKIALLFLLFSGNCFADNFKHFSKWETSDKIEFSAFVGLSAIDYAQTTWAVRQKDLNGNPLYNEANPFYGKRPSNDKVMLGQLIGVGMYYWAIGSQDNHPNSKLFRGIILGTKLAVILHNDAIGVKVFKSF